MKKVICILTIMVVGVVSLNAQKWDQLSGEQKMMKAKEFREDNQKYLKGTLGLTDEQTEDIDNVNLCFLSTLDRIDRYGKTDDDKKKYAKGLMQSRAAQLDAIMGADKRKQYITYIQDKLKTAGLL
jgi:predicted phage gp36 major capsid-like protein